MIGRLGVPGDVLRGISAARRGRPRVQVLTGPPGSGRTTVLRRITDRTDLPEGFVVLDDVTDPDAVARLRAEPGGGALLAMARPVADMVEDLVDDVIVVPPLGEEAAAALARRHAPIEVPDVTVAAVVAHAAGNPGALVQAAAGIDPAAPPGDAALPRLDLAADAVPDAFADLLARLSPAAATAVRLLSVLGPVPVTALAAAVRRGRGPALDPEALGAATWLDVLAVADRTVRLTHPALGRAAWALASRADRRRTSLALARHPGLDRADAAQHLIRAGLALHADELALVEEQAAAAHGRGALGDAVTLWLGASAQEVDTARRAHLLGAAGLVSAAAGRFARAGALLDQALDVEADPARRAELASVAATLETLGGQPEVARWRLLGEVERLRDLDRGAAGRVLAALTFPDGVIGDMGAAIAHGEEAVALGVLDGPLAGTVCGVLAHAHAVRGEAAAARWADQAVAAVAADAVPADQLGVVALHVGRSLALLDRGAEALAAVARLEGHIRQLGVGDATAVPSGMRAELAWRRGDWDSAMAELAATIGLADSTRQPAWRAFGLAIRARILAWRGDADGAAAALAEGRGDVDAGSLALVAYVMDAAEGIVALAGGRPEAALDALQRCLATDGLSGPIGADQARYRQALVEVALALGRRELAEEVRASTPIAECGSWTAGAEAMMDGLLATDPAEAVAALARAADAWHGSPFDRSLAQLHAARRRSADGLAPDDAALAEARATFAALGVTGLAAEADRLGSDGADGLGALGPVRRAVVHAAARGLRNAEIAEDLGIAVRTVENHLHRAYRQLGVRSRAELVRLLQGGSR